MKTSFESGGRTLYGKLEGRGKHAVVLLHGLCSSKNAPSSRMLAGALNERGITTFRFDMTGCGESEGKVKDRKISNWVEDAESALAYMRGRGHTTALYGGSMGSVVALHAADDEVTKLGLHAAVQNWPEVVRQRHPVLTDLWKFTRFAPYAGTFLHYELFDEAKGFVFDTQCTTPTLFTHASGDREVNYSQSHRLLQLFPKGTVKLSYKKAHSISQDPLSLTRQIEWLAQP